MLQISKNLKSFNQFCNIVLSFTLTILFSIHQKEKLAKIWGVAAPPAPLISMSLYCYLLQLLMHLLVSKFYQNCSSCCYLYSYCLSYYLLQLCSLPSLVSVYGTINDLSRVFFSFSSSLKKYTSLCKVSTCGLSEDIASYAMLLVSYVSFYVYNFHVPLRPLS